MFKSTNDLVVAKYGIAKYNTPEQSIVIEANAYSNGVNDAFKSFEKRIKFFNMYKDDIHKFSTECKKQYDIYYKEHWTKSHFKEPSFRDWLFNHCFGDIIK